jgi:uncharacterized protein
MVRLVCPICNRPFLQSQSEAMPFCSDRCRTIDLGRWLSEDYGVPVERHDEDDDGEQGDFSELQ